jgi:hypothetical protein
VISVKPGVTLGNLVPQMTLAAQVVASVYASHDRDCVITSGDDGEHTTIVHYVGCALDFRTTHLTQAGEAKIIQREIQAALGSQFDVVLKVHPSPCLHVEYDPR